MENPYHKAEIKPHYLDFELATLICFDLFNIVAASQSLAGEFEMADEDDDSTPSLMFDVHHQLAERRISQLLLQLAVFVRTYDDIMLTRSNADEYARLISGIDKENRIGQLNGEQLSIRAACNKIIHSLDFRPVYDQVQRDRNGSSQTAWHLTGEIELEGMLNNKRWEATLYLQPFLEDLISLFRFESISSAG
jgi:hypothetical protein